MLWPGRLRDVPLVFTSLADVAGRTKDAFTAEITLAALKNDFGSCRVWQSPSNPHAGESGTIGRG